MANAFDQFDQAQAATGGNAFDQFDEVEAAPQTKKVGAGEYMGRRFKSGLTRSAAALPFIGGGAASLVGLDELADNLFGTFQSMNADAQEMSNVQTDSTAGRIGGVVAEAVPALAGFAVNPAVGIVNATLPSLTDAGDSIERGLPAGRAAANLAVDTAINTAGVALPAGFGKSAKSIIASAVPLNIGLGAGGDAIKGEISEGYDEVAQKYDPMNAEARLADALFGAAGGYAASRPVARQNRMAGNAINDIRRMDASMQSEQAAGQNIADAFAKFDQYSPVLEANGVTSIEDPRFSRLVETMDNRQVRVSQGDSATADADDAVAAQLQAEYDAQQRPPVILSGEAPGSAFIPDDGALAGRAEMEARMAGAGRDMPPTQNMEDSLQRVMEANGISPDDVAGAFQLATMRQGRADADLANLDQIAPDYAGGNAAYRGGMEDGGAMRQVYMVGDSMFEPRMTPQGIPAQDAQGNYFGTLIDADGNQTATTVNPAKLKRFESPANPRAAQDFMRQSRVPPRGVGEQTMAGEKMPRRSTDRIAGDEIGGRTTPLADPYDAPARPPMGDVDVEQAPPRPQPGRTPRQGVTVEGEVIQPQREIGAPVRRIEQRQAMNQDVPLEAKDAELAPAESDIGGGSSQEPETLEQRVSRRLDLLKAWIPDMDWSVEGGRVFRDQDGQVAGRTQYQAKDPVIDDIRKAANANEKVSYTEMRRASEKAVSGEKLTAKERRIVQTIMGEMDMLDDVNRQFSEREANGGYTDAELEGINDLLDAYAYDGRDFTDETASSARSESAEVGRSAAEGGRAEPEIQARPDRQDGQRSDDEAQRPGDAQRRADTSQERTDTEQGQDRTDGGGRESESRVRGKSDDGILESYTEGEIRHREASARQQSQTKPDAPSAEEFTLAGSDRPADQAAARGAQDLFDQKPKAESKPDKAKTKALQEAWDEAYDLDLNDASKNQVRAYLRRMVKKGVLTEDEIKGYNYLFEDRDMAGADILDEVMGDLNGKMEQGKPSPYNAGTLSSNPFFDPEFWKRAGKDAGFAANKIKEAVSNSLNWGKEDAAWWVKGLKRTADMVTEAKDPRKHEAYGSMVRQIGRNVFEAYGSAMNTLAVRSGSDTFQRLTKTIYSIAGDTDGSRNGLEHSIELAYAQREKKFAKALDSIEQQVKEGYLSSDTAWKEIVNLVRNPERIRTGTLHEAAKEIRSFLDDTLKYMRDSGMEVGEIKNGYYPREFDLQMVANNPKGFESAIRQAYIENGIPQDVATQMADEMRANLLVGGESLFQKTVGKPQAEFLKGRVFGKSVDQQTHPLNKFLVSDPRVSLPSYLQRAVRRAELSRWMKESVESIKDEVGTGGSSALKRLMSKADREKVSGDSNANWEIIRQKLLDDGVNENAIKDFAEYVQEVAGMNGAKGSANAATSWIRTITAMSLLEKATLSSIGETFMPAIRSGNILDLHRSFGTTLKALINKNSNEIKQLTELGEDLGLISSTVNTSIIANRWGGGDNLSKTQSALLANNFRMTGLTQWTDATRLSSLKVGQIFVRRMSKQLLEGSGKLAARNLGELGVPEADAKAMAEWVSNTNDGIPTAADLMDAPANVKKAYMTALQKFDYQTIMRPNKSAKPRWATSDFGSLIFQLQSYNYAFYENVWKRNARGLAEAVKGDGYSKMERMKLAAPLMMMPVLVAAQGAVGELRDALLGDPSRKKTTQEKVLTAISRGVPVAPVDPLINVISGARYNSTAAQVLSGAGLGQIGKVVDSSVRLAEKNSPNTNTAERAAAKAQYDAFIEPAAAIVMANMFAEAPLQYKIAIAAARQVAGSGSFREKAYVEPMAGKKQDKNKDFAGSR
jgi:hypothetical protein